MKKTSTASQYSDLLGVSLSESVIEQNILLGINSELKCKVKEIFS